jgi:hypothetical protein
MAESSHAVKRAASHTSTAGRHLLGAASGSPGEASHHNVGQPMDRASGALNATAELASVERCSEPERRPSGSIVHATTLLASVERCSTPRAPGSPSNATGLAVLNTAPPGRAGRWRGGETRTQPSGVERGSTLASSVAVPAGLKTTTAITLSWSPNTRMSSSRLHRNRATTCWARRSANPRKQSARTIPIG